MTSITITQPDDWHLHLRDGVMLQTVLADTARVFARAIVMPNLMPPITTVAQALAYRQEILLARPPNCPFQPLMTLYLTDQTTQAEIARAAAHEQIAAVKLYPAGATTNSSQGVTRFDAIYPLLETMQKLALPLLIHGEDTRAQVDIFDREKVFIEQHLIPMIKRFPDLKIVLEHITTHDAVDFIRNQSDHVAATITAHHLLLNRNALLVGGVRPHNYCLPVLKRERHRQALLQAATSGDPKFFLGTDSAPHTQQAKQSACGCAGCYTALTAMPLYAEVFASVHALDKLDDFASGFGATFYGLPKNTGSITLTQTPWQVPSHIAVGADHRLVPFYAGETLRWRVSTVTP